MDGGTFGQRQREPLPVPYLAYDAREPRFLDYLLSASRNDYYAIEVKGATHLDFTDDTVVLPILKWLNITGDIAGGRVDRDHECGVAAFLRRRFTRWAQASFRRGISGTHRRNE